MPTSKMEEELRWLHELRIEAEQTLEGLEKLINKFAPSSITEALRDCWNEVDNIRDEVLEAISKKEQALY